MSVVKVTGLNVLSVYVCDLEEAKSFYKDTLGFADGGAMGKGWLLNAGDVTLYIEDGREECNKPPWQYAETCPCFSTDGVKDAFERLADAEVKIVTDYEEFTPEFGMFRIADKSGNIIEFAGKP